MKTIFQSAIILLILVTGSLFPLYAQNGSVGIGTANPNPSAILDLVSSDKGLLIPRMTTQQMMSIENPPPGLMIFDTEKNALCAFSNETNWQILGLLPNGNANDLLQLDENGKPYWAPFAGEANIDTLALGLGNALPEALVHIRDGNLRIDNGDIRSWGPINFLPDFDGSGDSRISFLASDYSTKAIIDEYGNFGLGTDMPSNKLDILSYNLDQGSVAQISNSDKSQFLRMFSGHSNDPNNWINWKDGNALIFSTANNDYSNWQERMRIAEYGFVGIGETNPNAPLSIQRTVNATDPNYLQLLHNRSNTDGASAMIGFSVSAADIGFGNYTPAAIGFNRGKGLVFQVHSGSGNPPNRMEISNTGVVTIPGLAGAGNRNIGVTSDGSLIEMPGSANLWNASNTFNFLYSLRKVRIGENVGTELYSPYSLDVNGTDSGQGMRIVASKPGFTSTALQATANTYGVVANAYGEDGEGAWGVRGIANGINGIRYGLYGVALGTGTSTNYGVYGTAQGGNINYAGYFDGNVTIKNKLHIGFDDPTNYQGYALAVEGKMLCEEVRVELKANWPDYVFLKDYRLRNLSELEEEISTLGHLPGIPGAREVEEAGLDTGEMIRKMMEKIEELTLYTIEQDKQIRALQNQLIIINNR